MTALGHLVHQAAAGKLVGLPLGALWESSRQSCVELYPYLQVLAIPASPRHY